MKQLYFALFLVSALPASAQTWRSDRSTSPISDCPVVYAMEGAGTANGLVYFFSGRNTTRGYASTTHQYNPATNAWTQLSTVLGTHWGMGFVSLNNRIYSIGGADGRDQCVADLFVFDPATGWSQLASMPTARMGAACTVLNGRIYAIGGRTGYADAYSNLTAVEEYTISTNTWSRVTALSTAVSYPYAAAINGSLVVAGGYQNGNGFLTLTSTWSPGALRWTAADAMPNRGNAAGVSATQAGLLYCIGGANSTTTVWSFNPAGTVGRQWSTAYPSSTYGQSHGAGVQVGRMVYVLGNASLNSWPGTNLFQSFQLPPVGAAPVAPVSLQQLPSGPVLGGSFVSMVGTIMDPDVADRVALEVEVQKNTVAFTGTANGTGVLGAQGACRVDYSGMDPAAPFQAYKWRARSADENGNFSAWVDFGTSDPDFTWDQDAPPATSITAPQMSRDVQNPVQLSCLAVADSSGLPVKYEFTITNLAGGNVATIVSTTPDVTANLPVSQNQYRMTVVAEDAFGHRSAPSVEVRFRVVFDDGVVSGQGDAKQACGFAAPVGSGSLAIALLIAILLCHHPRSGGLRRGAPGSF